MLIYLIINELIKIKACLDFAVPRGAPLDKRIVDRMTLRGMKWG
ncbi:Hypothetical protein ETEE_0640 [Edwardsiella anguillarum ET080813]|uniref:Uncharacterized protein n=1 Tax=Edwardsiella anguillarum ET080813 TaxID=667120 RepID=A0A076LG65_9GAMM|nr:Hypothetical protein ETEE_0640 [Edwardsiella anguillarum ET080813]